MNLKESNEEKPLLLKNPPFLGIRSEYNKRI
jgi:hypothetical protein